LKFTEKIAKSRFVPPFGGLKGKRTRFIYGSLERAWSTSY